MKDVCMSRCPHERERERERERKGEKENRGDRRIAAANNKKKK